MSASTKSTMLSNVETILADAAKRIQAATNNPKALIDVSLRNSTFDFISEVADVTGCDMGLYEIDERKYATPNITQNGYSLQIISE